MLGRSAYFLAPGRSVWREIQCQFLGIEIGALKYDIDCLATLGAEGKCASDMRQDTEKHAIFEIAAALVTKISQFDQVVAIVWHLQIENGIETDCIFTAGEFFAGLIKNGEARVEL